MKLGFGLVVRQSKQFKCYFQLWEMMMAIYFLFFDILFDKLIHRQKLQMNYVFLFFLFAALMCWYMNNNIVAESSMSGTLTSLSKNWTGDVLQTVVTFGTHLLWIPLQSCVGDVSVRVPYVGIFPTWDTLANARPQAWVLGLSHYHLKLVWNTYCFCSEPFSLLVKSQSCCDGNVTLQPVSSLGPF